MSCCSTVANSVFTFRGNSDASTLIQPVQLICHRADSRLRIPRPVNERNAPRIMQQRKQADVVRARVAEESKYFVPESVRPNQFSAVARRSRSRSLFLVSSRLPARLRARSIFPKIQNRDGMYLKRLFEALRTEFGTNDRSCDNVF